MKARRGQHVPNFCVQQEPMLVVQLHHPGWRRPPCRMEQQVPFFFTIRLLSSRRSCQTGRDVTDKKYTSSCRRVANDIRGTVERS